MVRGGARRSERLQIECREYRIAKSGGAPADPTLVSVIPADPHGRQASPHTIRIGSIFSRVNYYERKVIDDLRDTDDATPKPGEGAEPSAYVQGRGGRQRLRGISRLRSLSGAPDEDRASTEQRNARVAVTSRSARAGSGGSPSAFARRRELRFVTPPRRGFQKRQAADQHLVLLGFDAGKDFLGILDSNGADPP